MACLPWQLAQTLTVWVLTVVGRQYSSLVLARYVPNGAKEEYTRYWRPSRPATNDRLQGPFTHFEKISNDHNSATRQPTDFAFGSRVGLSGMADRTALFQVGSNPRWRPVAILKRTWGFRGTAHVVLELVEGCKMSRNFSCKWCITMTLKTSYSSQIIGYTECTVVIHTDTDEWLWMNSGRWSFYNNITCNWMITELSYYLHIYLKCAILTLKSKGHRQ